MHWRRKPDGEAEAVDAASKIFKERCDVRDALPRDERGQFSPKEMDAMRAGKRDWDDLPANASPRYREAQEAVTASYNAMIDVERSYFRFNIFGMRCIRDAMLSLGAAYGSDGPEWPHAPEEYWELEEEDQRTKFPELYAARDAALRWSRNAGAAGIPLHKLGSNDGWIVTPEECTAAVSAVRGHGRTETAQALIAAGIDSEGWLERWNAWIQWIEDAADHDGFEVH